MKRIVYSCPFVPAEWIAAHGMQPSRIVPCAAQQAPHPAAGMGVCPYACAFVNEVCEDTAADAVVMTTRCDQMRRASERIERSSRVPVFLFHVPATWQTTDSQRFYIEELRRLGRFLVRLGGEAPANGDLTEVMRAYDVARAKLREAREHLSSRPFAEAIARFHREGTTDFDRRTAPQRSGQAIPVALVGGPLLSEHFAIFDMIEKCGGDVVLDATSTGERTLPAPFNDRQIGVSPLLTLAGSYFGSIPDVSSRPNSRLYEWLGRELAARPVRGIIFRHYVWCDKWRAEAERMRQWAALPFLILDTDEEVAPDLLVSRIQSFLETLK